MALTHSPLCSFAARGRFSDSLTFQSRSGATLIKQTPNIPYSTTTARTAWTYTLTCVTNFRHAAAVYAAFFPSLDASLQAYAPRSNRTAHFVSLTAFYTDPISSWTCPFDCVPWTMQRYTFLCRRLDNFATGVIANRYRAYLGTSPTNLVYTPLILVAGTNLRSIAPLAPTGTRWYVRFQRRSTPTSADWRWCGGLFTGIQHA